MLKNPMDELLDKSKDWILLPRASSVAEEAVSFLRSAFEIEAGFLSYGRRPRENGADYLRGSKRWFKSWGLDTPQGEIQRAIRQSEEFAGYVTERQWFSVDELPTVWKGLLDHDRVRQVGVWMVNLDKMPVGLFVLALKGHREHSAREIISRCMAHICVVLELVVTRRLAEELSLRDPLTQTLNRRGFLLQFDSLTAQQVPLTVVVVDLDDFKMFNDKHGHIAGDEILIGVADVLYEHAQQSSGLCARFGGDEFVIAYRYATQDPQRVAQEVAERIMTVGVKASAGCAVLGSEGDDFDTCYRIADRRLYEMKKHK